MSTQEYSGPPIEKQLPVYVYEAPVRLWHWVMAIAMFVLMGTGYLIGSPLPSVEGEASEHFLFGYIRFTHFAAGYVFALFFLLRVYWAIVGNRYARDIFLVPLAMLNGAWWNGILERVKYYLFLKPMDRDYIGHNPLAEIAMFFMYILGSIFMICTGFSMYGEGLGQESWAFRMFSSWVIPLLGNNTQNVHTWHHFGMWYLIVFAMVHIYMVIREEVFGKVTMFSTMVNGWRSVKLRR
jgi:Ni/Fe-hydrogenase 1 B-type cytochrome subunit